MRRENHSLRRLVAILLTVATIITTAYQPDRSTRAETTAVHTNSVVENEIQTESTSSFGNLLNKELEEKLDEQ